jgi:hypothetical protein
LIDKRNEPFPWLTSSANGSTAPAVATRAVRTQFVVVFVEAGHAAESITRAMARANLRIL